MTIKNKFDPAKTRNILLGDLGHEWQLQRSFENSKHRGGLSSSAHADLGSAIECILVGLDDPASRLIVKARSWATEAIDSEKETVDSLAYQTIAMCDWLLENRHNSDIYRQLAFQIDRSLEIPMIANDPVNVSLMLPKLVDSRSYERVLQIFERTPKLVKPSSLNKLRNEAQLCFVIAQHRLGNGYTNAEVDAACDKFMLKNMDNWLGNGHSVRAIEWLKIICENREDSSLTPKEIVLNSYNYLPNCRRPI